MENASKALIMAGGVMISIAVISVAVYFYTNMKGYASANQDVLSSTQIHSFNRFYTAYNNSTNKIRVVDAVNILNRAVEDEVTVSNDCSSTISPITSDGRVVAYKVSDVSKYLDDNVKYTITYSPEGKVEKVSISY